MGDFARAYDARVGGEASHFVWVNRSKESLTLDLKQPAALAVLQELVAEADVLVQNLAPGAAARMGLGAEALQAKHPRLIVCDISGYGEDGPYRDKKAYDLLDTERSGLPVGHGHAGRSVQVRQLHRRHRGGHVRVHRHPCGAAAARQDRQGLAHRRVDARVARRVDGLPDVLRLRGRTTSAAQRRIARDHLSVRPVSLLATAAP